MGKWLLCPAHASNAFFATFTNCLVYRSPAEFAAQLRLAEARPRCRVRQGHKIGADAPAPCAAASAAAPSGRVGAPCCRAAVCCQSVCAAMLRTFPCRVAIWAAPARCREPVSAPHPRALSPANEMVGSPRSARAAELRSGAAERGGPAAADVGGGDGAAAGRRAHRARRVAAGARAPVRRPHLAADQRGRRCGLWFFNP